MTFHQIIDAAYSSGRRVRDTNPYIFTRVIKQGIKSDPEIFVEVFKLSGACTVHHKGTTYKTAPFFEGAEFAGFHARVQTIANDNGYHITSCSPVFLDKEESFGLYVAGRAL